MRVHFAVPDVESVPFQVLKREADYEVREVEVIFVTSFYPTVKIVHECKWNPLWYDSSIRLTE
jgi:hypothetical protein